MAGEIKKEIQLEIAHVLFIDIVGYSKLSINDQRAAIAELTQAVRTSEQVQNAEAGGRLIKIPTGDGMALVFYKSPEEPVECALEISRALKDRQLRMGVHSGPVSGVIDVNGQANLAGAGLNMAQRVMDCSDAGHILLSKRVADDLGEYEHWRRLLHDLGECEVKHGTRVSIVNLHGDEVGNPQLPQKFVGLHKRRAQKQWAVAIAAVTVVAAVATSFFILSRRSASIPEKSIAVLPFENLSDDKSNAYFADGIQDEILTKLASIADLKVISRTSTAKYKSKPEDLKTVSQQLGVANVVEGSVQRVADKVRVNVQLIDARADSHRWAKTYDRDIKDVFAVETEVSQEIADALQAKLSPNEKKAIEQPPTTDLAAFDLYSRAKSLILRAGFSATNDSDLRKAIELLDEAVKRDPSFFDAYCQLAYAHEHLYAIAESDHTPARLALAEAAVQAATRLRSNAAETHLARAQYLYYGLREYAGALAELEIARRALPNDPRLFELTGYILRRRGQQEQGLQNLQHAVELDPRNFYTLQQIALSYQQLGRYAEAIAALDRALTIAPENIETRANRGLWYICWKGDTRPLHETIDSMLAQGPSAIVSAADSWFFCALAERDPTAAERALVALGDNNCWGESAINLSRRFGEGLLARMSKDNARARSAFEKDRAQQEKIVQSQPDYGPALCVLGLIDAALGRKDLALDEGRRAIELTPVEKDGLNGSIILQYFAVTAAWAGEKDLALKQLEAGLRAPAAALMLSYGALKLHPFWDPLRGDPRFEKIVASLAPKSSDK